MVSAQYLTEERKTSGVISGLGWMLSIFITIRQAEYTMLLLSLMESVRMMLQPMDTKP